MQAKPLFYQILEPYKNSIEQSIKNYIPLLGKQTELRDACEYALMNGGKRFRPALVFMINKALGSVADVSLAALGIEFFHTASLIADDLPCMDDDDERRDRPSLHKVYGESVALLASYALIAEGYGCLAKNARLIQHASVSFSSEIDQRCLLALENATHNTGILGATGGQYLDLKPASLDLEGIRDVLFKKTVTLFEISFVLGWIFGGGDLSSLDKVKKSAEHFGLAFQIADDIGDMEQDQANGRLINIANLLGKAEALRLFHEEITQFTSSLIDLKVYSIDFQALVDLLLYKTAH